VAIRTRLKHLTPADEKVLRLVGAHLGSLASRDLKRRCRDGLDHDGEAWAARKRDLTPLCSSRWAGAVTKASHDQWALARRCQFAHIQNLQAAVRTIRYRLSLPVGAKGGKGAPGGYRSRREWHAKSRRLHLLQDRLEREQADREAGIVHVVRGGKRLARTRHHLPAAQLTKDQWRQRWEAERWFLQADGESGKRFGNETIRVSPDGEVSIRLPAPLKEWANAPHGRYVLACRVAFPEVVENGPYAGRPGGVGAVVEGQDDGLVRCAIRPRVILGGVDDRAAVGDPAGDSGGRSSAAPFLVAGEAPGGVPLDQEDRGDEGQQDEGNEDAEAVPGRQGCSRPPRAGRPR
jgi:hypothetical protein